MGIAPMHSGFADRRVSTSPLRRISFGTRKEARSQRTQVVAVGFYITPHQNAPNVSLGMSGSTPWAYGAGFRSLIETNDSPIVRSGSFTFSSQFLRLSSLDL